MTRGYPVWQHVWAFDLSYVPGRGVPPFEAFEDMFGALRWLIGRGLR